MQRHYNQITTNVLLSLFMFQHYSSVTLREPDAAALEHFHWLFCGVGEVAAIAELWETGRKMGKMWLQAEEFGYSSLGSRCNRLMR